jgi:hypothetical protein
MGFCHRVCSCGNGITILGAEKAATSITKILLLTIQVWIWIIEARSIFLFLVIIISIVLLSERSCMCNFISAIHRVVTLISPVTKMVCLRIAPVWRRRDCVALLVGLLPSQSYIVSNLSAIELHLHFTLSSTLQSQLIPALNCIIINRSITSLPCRQLPES